MNKLEKNKITEKTFEELVKLAIAKKQEIAKTRTDVQRGSHKNVRLVKTFRADLARILTALNAKTERRVRTKLVLSKVEG